MIFGVGVDIVRSERLSRLWARHGLRLAKRVLASDEFAGFEASRDPARFLAKRFAAKEAFAKALGSGIAAPATLHAVRISHDARGQPGYNYSDQLLAFMAERRLSAHLSLSDEKEYIVAFAVIEQA